MQAGAKRGSHAAANDAPGIATTAETAGLTATATAVPTDASDGTETIPTMAM
jgi:hypothetical protein